MRLRRQSHVLARGVPPARVPAARGAPGALSREAAPATLRGDARQRHAFPRRTGASGSKRASRTRERSSPPLINAFAPKKKRRQRRATRFPRLGRSARADAGCRRTPETKTRRVVGRRQRAIARAIREPPRGGRLSHLPPVRRVAGQAQRGGGEALPRGAARARRRRVPRLWVLSPETHAGARTLGVSDGHKARARRARRRTKLLGRRVCDAHARGASMSVDTANLVPRRRLRRDPRGRRDASRGNRCADRGERRVRKGLVPRKPPCASRRERTHLFGRGRPLVGLQVSLGVWAAGLVLLLLPTDGCAATRGVPRVVRAAQSAAGAGGRGEERD